MRGKEALFRGARFVLLALVLLFLLDYGCVFKNFFGIPCPGCGMTRAHLAALRLDWKEAFSFHPLWPFALPLVGLNFFLRGESSILRKCNLVFVILFVGVYLVRMVLLFPDTPPMEYNEDCLVRRIFLFFQSILTRSDIG